MLNNISMHINTLLPLLTDKLNLPLSLNLNLNLNLIPLFTNKLNHLNLNLHLLHQDLTSLQEDQLLNGIWIGLLSVEALMVLAVALRGLVGSVTSRRGPHYHRSPSRHGSVDGGLDSDCDWGVTSGSGGMSRLERDDGGRAWERQVLVG